jgi:hypothetical protein
MIEPISFLVGCATVGVPVAVCVYALRRGIRRGLHRRGRPSGQAGGKPHGRRWLMTAGAAGLAAGATLAPTAVKADLNASDLNVIEQLLRAIERLMRAVTQLLENILNLWERLFDWLMDVVFHFIAAYLPQWFWDFTNEILGLLEGAETFLRTGSIDGSFARSYPEGAATDPDHQMHQIYHRQISVRERAMQSARINARIAEEQGAMVVEEALIVEDGQSHGSMAALGQAQLAMLGSIAARLGQLSTQLAAQNQMAIDQAIVSSHEKVIAWQLQQEFIDDSGDTIAPPHERQTE